MDHSRIFGETVKLLDNGSDSVTKQAKEMSVKFQELTGWDLPIELQYWLDKYMPEGSNYWIDSFELKKLVFRFEGNEIISFFKQFSNHHYLFTGLFEAGRDGSGDGIFFYLGQHCKELQNVYWYDHEEDKVGFDENSLSLMAVNWELMENEDLEDIEFEEDKDLQSEVLDNCGFENIEDYKNKIQNLRKQKDKLKSMIKYFEQPTDDFVQEIADRYKRSYWLSHLLVKEICYEFKIKVGQSPSFLDWRAEKEKISKDIHLYNYWIFAHFYLGNHRTCREVIDIGKKYYPCGLISAINEYIGSAIDNNEQESFIEKTREAATEKHFEG